MSYNSELKNNNAELQAILDEVNNLPQAGAGENGATFTPAVSAEGVISWTNDKGLENPAPVNIKGPQGEDGNRAVHVGDGNMPEDATLQILLDGSDEEQALKDELIEYIDGEIATELAKRGQLKPEFAKTLEEMTDTTKMYVLLDKESPYFGYIFAYMLTETEIQPTYTNVLKTAQTSVTDTTPFNSTGYQLDSCFNSSGGIDNVPTTAIQQTGGKNMVTGFIPITSTDKIYFSKAYIYKFATQRFCCWFYDGSGGKLCMISPNTLNSGVWTSAATMGEINNVVCLDLSILKTISSNSLSYVSTAKFVRFSLQTDGSDPSEAVITINEEITESGGTTTSYAWTNTGHAFVPADYEDRIIDLEEVTADHEKRLEDLEEKENAVRIIAPPKITVLAGHELNIYTDNMLLCDNIKNYEVRWSFTGNLNGMAIAQEDCLRFPATIASAMTDVATLRVRDKLTGDLITSAQIPVEIITEPNISGKNVIFIGDSLTEATYYPAEIQNNLSGGGITSLGTRSNYIYINEVGMRVPHEGRSGWSVANYLSAESYNGATNSFYNTSTSTFDFSYYMTQQGYTTVDAVCIGLGTNGVTAISTNVNGINTMIDSIHAYDADIKVFIALITPPAIQDGWRSIQNTDEWKRQQLALVEAYITAFGNRTDNVYVVPWYIAIHRDYDFPRVKVAESARNPIEITRVNNNVHPSVYGYLKMADMLYNILISKIV